MSALSPIPKYKGKVINLLLKNKDLITLVNPQPNKNDEIDIIDVLLGGSWIIDGSSHVEQGHIFDYDFVDDTVTEDKTFIFVETDVGTIYDNMFVDFTLYICIFTSKKLVRLTEHSSPSKDEVSKMGYYVTNRYGNRIDILCEIVDSIVNGNGAFESLGDVTPASRGYDQRYCPNSKYYGRCLKYKITNYNDGDNNCGD